MPAHQKTCLALGFGLAVLVAGAARAQEAFPSKPIEVVTHAGVGGGTDITARMMMVQAPAALKTELVVANKTGGSGSASLGYAASRAKDGHTIMLITQTHLLTLLQGKGAGVKVGDLVGIARATEDPQVLMVGANSPYKTAQDFIAAAKAKSLKFGTTQIGSVDHIAVVGFAEKAGLLKPIVVPFRGGGDIVVNLVGGNLDGALLNYAEAESQIKANEVRALIAFSKNKMDSLPQTPTAAEIGIPAVYSTTRGFAVLKGTPEDRIKVLEEGVVKAMKGQIYQDYLKSSGQSRDSVVGRAEWQAEIDEFLKTGDAALTSIGIKK
ncbi:Bug family tripartite tricarboxylate transporter substrate binding protein [Bosea rubneri]|uniref:Tripartite tricarboxylate transporter substrate binding protein n=1 Tax=Bosea rubneri TaxID=3075434 RepID=A0ABU3S128_9HYPH|nr:tripartite tricarboxylate transporter substrate binding protein [Bosea sp. ZW T0_25]MDU0338497.1 tripartite tricarboxylate transporter substrate binding protein [Bosea sp. ZW T0_25]